jgi:triosephosphate isomerase
MHYLIGNWKSHKTTTEGLAWFEEFSRSYSPREGLETVVAPTFVALERLAEYCRSQRVPQLTLAAQDLSPFPRGSYTGAVAADLLKGLAKYVLVGHSERRRYFRETAQDSINKVGEAADSGLIPILCIETIDSLRQYSPIKDLECDRLLLAYTPVDALNFRIAESPQKTAEALAVIRSFFPTSPLLLGGAINASNAAPYLDLEDLDGLFVGQASLTPSDFAALHQLLATRL